MEGMEKNGEGKVFLPVSQQDIEIFTIETERQNTLQASSERKGRAKRPQDMGKPNIKRGQTDRKNWANRRKDTGKRMKRSSLFGQNILSFIGKQGLK